MTASADCPAARSSRTPVSPSAFDSFEPSGRRISGWWAKPAAPRAQEPPEPDLRRRRLEQVAAADDEVDALAQVVDDDAEPVRPVAVPVADRRGRRRRHLARARARRARPSRPPSPPPSATRSTGPSSPRSRQPPGQPGPDHGRPCAAPTRRTSTGSSRSRRRGRAAEPLERVARRRVVVGLADRPEVRPRSPSQSRSSRSAASNSGRQRCRSWSSIRSSTRRAGGAGQAPDLDRVRDVAEVEVAGRRRREPRQRSPAAGHVRSAVARSSPSPVAAPGRVPRAPASPRSAAGRARAGRPGASVPRSPSTPAAGPRAPARRRGSPRRPASAFARPASRASSRALVEQRRRSAGRARRSRGAGGAARRSRPRLASAVSHRRRPNRRAIDSSARW